MRAYMSDDCIQFTAEEMAAAGVDGRYKGAPERPRFQRQRDDIRVYVENVVQHRREPEPDSQAA